MVWRLATWSLWLAVVISTDLTAYAQNRPLAPGVLTVIPTDPQYEETYTGPINLVEVVQGLPELDWSPAYAAKSRTVFERAKLVTLRREIWNLEFAFKPVRTVYVDVPQPSGKMQRKLIWYLVYRVRYLGGDLEPEAVKDAANHAVYRSKPISRENRYFFPKFFLDAHGVSKVYLDRIIPAAKRVIEQREVQGEPLLNSVEIGREPVPLSKVDDPHELWGLATWEDVDPRIDYFSIYIQGLTNAYKPVDLPNQFKQGDPPGTGRDFLSKSLRLNFWRPGDAVREHEDEVYFGVPYDADPQRQHEILSTYGLKERLDYLWVYR